LWEASVSPTASSADDLERPLKPFREAAERIGVKDCAPASQVVVPSSELSARLGAEEPILSAWIAMNLEQVVQTLQELATRHPNAIADWVRSVVEHQLPMLAKLREVLEAAASAPEPDPNRERVTTKDAVARREAEYRRRWEAGEFESPTDARRHLELDVNARPDGTCAQPGEPDHHRRPSIDRLTRGWFPKKP
jgi:hypothetical protein